jgi:hypothetical protein
MEIKTGDLMLVIKDYRNTEEWDYNEALADELMGIIKPEPKKIYWPIFVPKERQFRPDRVMDYNHLDRAFAHKLTKLIRIPEVKHTGRSFTPGRAVYNLTRAYGNGLSLWYGRVYGYEQANEANKRVNAMINAERKRRGIVEPEKIGLYQKLSDARFACVKPIKEKICINPLPRNSGRFHLMLFYAGAKWKWPRSYVQEDVAEQHEAFISLIQQVNKEKT